MKNIKVSKKMLALAMFGIVILTKTPNDSYAKEKEEIINIYDFDYINDYIIAKDEITIKEKPTSDSEILGTLEKGKRLKLIMQTDGYYEVLYNNKLAYVRDIYVDTISEKSFKQAGYITNKCNLYDTKKLDIIIKNLNELEFIKIYDEFMDVYYVKADGKFGFIKKENIKMLDGMYAVVDISSQNVELYQDNELLLESDVITGNAKNNATPTGIFEIANKSDISTSRYLVGPGYRSYVDYMMKFNGNIGFHDAEYHIDENGKSHGWRDSSEFGGETYLSNGSHGCVNMPNASATILYNYVKPYVVDEKNKVKVLVKK